MRQQTTDNGLQTAGRQSLDPGQRSVVGSQWSRIRKDALLHALSALLFEVRRLIPPMGHKMIRVKLKKANSAGKLHMIIDR